MIRITTLVENSPGEHLSLRHEHGLSFFVEIDGRAVLFDTGQTNAFMENAARLRLDLTKTEYVVLSHGHYDHSGGFLSFCDLGARFELVVGQGFFQEKYAFRNGAYEFLGNNFSEATLRERGIAYSESPIVTRELIPGVFVLGSFPRVHRDELINPRFLLLRDGVFVPDAFDDEVMLVVDTPKGLVALLGCSHPGMRTLLDAVRSRFDKPIYAVLGGTHLVEANAEALSKSLGYLYGSDIRLIGVSHCTGPAPMKMLESTEARYFHNRTGTALLFP